MGRDAVVAFALASNLDASHLRAFQRCEAVVVVVSEVGNEVSVCAHVHVVRVNELMLVLRIS
jgi:hypothetical protein